MNRIALMFMNQQDECEQDSRLALYKTNPPRVKGVDYTDNYLTSMENYSTAGNMYLPLHAGVFSLKGWRVCI